MSSYNERLRASNRALRQTIKMQAIMLLCGLLDEDELDKVQKIFASKKGIKFTWSLSYDEELPPAEKSGEEEPQQEVPK